MANIGNVGKSYVKKKDE
ncbi:hypothetical protein TALC_00745 [Thermoplasmatales archaeon BRNA1]|nr:hypothetical protein TALC_00745 [Thermoplasmatales archaeon BRNA1]